METIAPSLIKQLREITGSGMCECKKVLEVTNGNLDDAIALLWETGIAVNTRISRCKTYEEAYKIMKSNRNGEK